MARAGSDPFVEQVRAANDVVDVVGAHVALVRAGMRWKGLCPFHQEKTPSFHVSGEHQTYHCFGCGAGGDVFSFVMALENMTFPEALRHLAERAGIPVPERTGPAGDQLERIRQALQIARTYFRECLASSDGREASAYLTRRGIGAELRERFGLGFATDSWDGLLRHARRWVGEADLADAGLVVHAQSGRLYDRFRNRVIVPIESGGGAPVGFGGRNLGPEEPKYLNSPETAVYKKGSVLFGAAQARAAIREESHVLVVEGYFDVLSLAQAGLGAAVGTCGTALSSEQARQLARYGVRIVLLFDGDPAGVRAALRALPIVVPEGAEVRVLVPPVGLDPDDWVRERGAEEVRAALAHAWTPVAFLEERVRAGDLARDEAARQAVALVARLDDPLTRDLWVQEIAGRFGLREEAVWAGAEGERGAKNARPARPVERSTGADGWKSLERICLQVALENPGRAGEILAAIAGARPRAELAAVLDWLAAEAARGAGGPPSSADLVARAREALPEVPALGSVLVREESGPGPDVEALLAVLRERSLRFRMAQVTRDIRRAEAAGDEVALARLLAEMQELAGSRSRDLTRTFPSPGLEAGAGGSI